MRAASVDWGPGVEPRALMLSPGPEANGRKSMSAAVGRSSTDLPSRRASAECEADDSPRKKTLYKTELCRSYEETRQCRYGVKCQFAHGAEELRQILRHPKYKTEMCRKYELYGACPYGNRCRFIHRGSGSGSAQDALGTSSLSGSGGSSSEQLPPVPPGEDGPPLRSSTPLSRRGSSSLEDAEGEALRRLPVFRQLSIDEGQRLLYGRSNSFSSLSSRHTMRHSDESWRRMSVASSSGTGSSSGATSSGTQLPLQQQQAQLAAAAAAAAAASDSNDEWHPVAGFPSPFVAADPSPGQQQQQPPQQLQQPPLVHLARAAPRRSLGSAFPPPVPHLHVASPLSAPLRPRSTSAAHLQLAAAQQQMHLQLQQQQELRLLQMQALQQELAWRQQRQLQLQQLLLQAPGAEQDPAIMAELAVLRSLA